jgi:arginyl-tRNA synthetase
MIRDNHYNSLKDHISNLITGISEHQEDLPDNIIDQISEEYYQKALETLEMRKRKLLKREEEYKKAIEKFKEDYEQIRKTWKKDIIKLKPELGRNSEILQSIGVPHK